MIIYGQRCGFQPLIYTIFTPCTTLRHLVCQLTFLSFISFALTVCFTIRIFLQWILLLFFKCFPSFSDDLSSTFSPNLTLTLPLSISAPPIFYILFFLFLFTSHPLFSLFPPFLPLSPFISSPTLLPPFNLSRPPLSLLLFSFLFPLFSLFPPLLPPHFPSSISNPYRACCRSQGSERTGSCLHCCNRYVRTSRHCTYDRFTFLFLVELLLGSLTPYYILIVFHSL